MVDPALRRHVAVFDADIDLARVESGYLPTREIVSREV